MKKVLLITVLCILVASSAWSFDNMRKGFVLGGGLGMAPSAKFSIDGFAGDVNKTGFGLNFLAGYGWDEFNMIVYEGNIAGYSENSINVTQGFNGASWYHYFGPMGHSFYSTVGLGMYFFSIEQYSASPGGAILLGGGYEFSDHWQVGAYLASGKTSDGPYDFKHTHFSILVSGVAF